MGSLVRIVLGKKAKLLVAQCPNESGDSGTREDDDKDAETENSSTKQDTRLALISTR